jgi:hypothetical protein
MVLGLQILPPENYHHISWTIRRTEISEDKFRRTFGPYGAEEFSRKKVYLTAWEIRQLVIKTLTDMLKK